LPYVVGMSTALCSPSREAEDACPPMYQPPPAPAGTLLGRTRLEPILSGGKKPIAEIGRTPVKELDVEGVDFQVLSPGTCGDQTATPMAPFTPICTPSPCGAFSLFSRPGWGSVVQPGRFAEMQDGSSMMRRLSMADDGQDRHVVSLTQALQAMQQEKQEKAEEQRQAVNPVHHQVSALLDEEEEEEDSDASDVDPDQQQQQKASTGPQAPPPGALHPSIGSEGHAMGICRRCCFFPRGRCANGYSCEFCHYEHEKRKRKNKKGSRNLMGSAAAYAQAQQQQFRGGITRQLLAARGAAYLPPHQAGLLAGAHRPPMGYAGPALMQHAAYPGFPQPMAYPQQAPPMMYGSVPANPMAAAAPQAAQFPYPPPGSHACAPPPAPAGAHPCMMMGAPQPQSFVPPPPLQPPSHFGGMQSTGL